MATASQLYTQEVPMIFAKYLMDWMKESTAVNILVTGKTGTGKSTLINSVLGIAKVTERHTVKQKPKPTRMEQYQNIIGNEVQVYMWDSPSLDMQATEKDKMKAIEDIKRNCKDIDLCLFCVDMSTLRFNIPEYSEAMKELGEILGRDIWKNTLFVLTFANKFLLRIEDDYRNDPEGKKQKFEHQVGLWKIKLRTNLEKQMKLDPLIAQNTKVVPVGDHHSLQLFPNDNERWLNELWLQAISAVRHTGKPAVVKICQHLLRDRESNQLSVTFTLLMRENARGQEQEDDGDNVPQGQLV